MAATTTIEVPHLGGITVGYRLLVTQPERNKPTLVLINSMCTTSSLFKAQFESKSITDVVNLLAIEPLGHGATSCPSEHFTYWDSAIMALQVLDVLNIKEAYALGTSQGGWIVVQMALLAPDRILGLLPLGTSMDSESTASREKGCWDPKALLQGFVNTWISTVPNPDFVVGEDWRDNVVKLGFSDTVDPGVREFWDNTMKNVYRGEEGRKKLVMAVNNLLHREELLSRLSEIKCPVYWLQGPEDPVFGKFIPAEHIKLFTSSPDTDLTFVEGAGHYLNATSPKETEKAILKMVQKHPQQYKL